jgi:signal transduction histidine kinase
MIVLKERRVLWAMLGVTSVISILLIISTIDNIVSSRNHVLNMLTNRGRSLALSLEMTGAMLHWSNDEGFGPVIDGISAREKDVAYLAVEDSEGGIIAQSGPMAGEVDRRRERVGDRRAARFRLGEEIFELTQGLDWGIIGEGAYRKSEVSLPGERFLVVGLYVSSWNGVLKQAYIQAGFIMASLVALIAVFVYLFHVTHNYFVVREKSKEMQQEIELSSRLAAIGSLAAGVAHEIRNPLGSIKGFSELLYERCDEKGPQKKYLEIMIGEVKRLDRIVNDLLSFSRQKPPQRRPADIGTIVEDVIAVAKGNGYSQIRVERYLADGLSSVSVDSDQIRQVLLNLVMNALQAMEKKPTGLLRVGARVKEDHLYIEVADDGEGIARENMDRVFDPFFTTKPDGTGLGLPIAHGIVQSHGGSMSLVSEVGKGTTFTVRIPVSDLLGK